MSQFFVDSVTGALPILDDLTFFSGDDSTTTHPISGVIVFSSGVFSNTGHPIKISMSPGHVTYTMQWTKTTSNPNLDPAGQGVSMFFNGNFSVDSSRGLVSTFAPPNIYTNVTSAMSPYTVNNTDGYISCNTSGGPITLNFPNTISYTTSSTLILWIVKDRTGNAATNNITITSSGSLNTFDGLTSTVIKSNFGSKGITTESPSFIPSTPAYEVYFNSDPVPLSSSVINVTGTSASLTAGNTYIANNSGLVTLTLPTSAALGDEIEIIGQGTGGWTIVYGAGQQIIYGNQATTLTIGSLASTNRFDCVTIRCVTASVTAPIFQVSTGPQGNFTVV